MRTEAIGRTPEVRGSPAPTRAGLAEPDSRATSPPRIANYSKRQSPASRSSSPREAETTARGRTDVTVNVSQSFPTDHPAWQGQCCAGAPALRWEGRRAGTNELRALSASSRSALATETCENQHALTSRCASRALCQAPGVPSRQAVPTRKPPPRALRASLGPVWGRYAAWREARGQAGPAAWRKGPARGQRVAQGRTL